MLKNSLFLVGAKFAIRASGIAVALVLPRFWTPETYGGFATVFSLLLLLEAFAPLGAHQYLLRELPRRPWALWPYLKRALGIAAIGAVLGALGYTAVLTRLDFLGSQFVLILGFTVAYLVLRGPLFILQAVHQAREDGLKVFRASSAESTIKLVGVSAVAALGGVIWHVFAVLLLSRVVSIILLLTAVPRELEVVKPEAPAPVRFADILVACVPLIWLDPLLEFDVHVSQFLLGALVEPRVAAYFKVGISVVTVMAMITYATNEALIPRLSVTYHTGNRNQRREALRAALTLQSALALVAVPVLLGAAQAVPWVFGEPYRPAVPIVMALAFTIPIRYWAHTLGNVQLAADRAHVWTLGLAAGAGVNLTLNLLLLSRLEVWAAVIATACAQLTLLVFLWTSYRRRVGELTPADVFGFRTLMRALRGPTSPQHAVPELMGIQDRT